MTEKNEALRLAQELDAYHTASHHKEAAAELRRLHQHELAHDYWHKKTEWVQETARPHELGMHRADVMRQRLEQAEAQRDALLEALRAMLEQFNYNTITGIVHDESAAIAKARAAIKAVEGEKT